MKRSNFIKSLLGIVAVPFVAVKAMDSLGEDKSVTDIVDNCDKTETPKNESWIAIQEEEAARAWQESYDRLINEGHRAHHQLLKKHGNKKLSELGNVIGNL